MFGHKFLLVMYEYIFLISHASALVTRAHIKSVHIQISYTCIYSISIASNITYVKAEVLWDFYLFIYCCGFSWFLYVHKMHDSIPDSGTLVTEVSTKISKFDHNKHLTAQAKLFHLLFIHCTNFWTHIKHISLKAIVN